jgi:hypothetical protein
VDSDRMTLAASVSHDEVRLDEQIGDINRRLVPLMGQHGWHIVDDGLRWSRRRKSLRYRQTTALSSCGRIRA